MSIVRLENLLKSGASGRLEKIVQDAKNMGELTQSLKDGVDDELAAAIISASLRDDELTVLCSSSAWASRLRFEADALLAAAKKCGFAPSRCQVRVTREGMNQA